MRKRAINSERACCAYGSHCQPTDCTALFHTTSRCGNPLDTSSLVSEARVWYECLYAQYTGWQTNKARARTHRERVGERGREKEKEGEKRPAHERVRTLMHIHLSWHISLYACNLEYTKKRTT
uniref:Uncharacterized protein n=1 Tax=Trypanosoma vivax (strain Y486) TaxID=1055687 RepID=G0UBB4_TRYVY|nr:hypothetical protein, unlikely [Trypanosoma vivax Y486]